MAYPLTFDDHPGDQSINKMLLFLSTGVARGIQLFEAQFVLWMFRCTVYGLAQYAFFFMIKFGVKERRIDFDE